MLPPPVDEVQLRAVAQSSKLLFKVIGLCADNEKDITRKKAIKSVEIEEFIFSSYE